MRLDQIEHHLRGDARVDRAAAFAQDGEPGFGRERMGGDDHVPLRGDERLRLKPALAFRLLEGERARRQLARGEAEREQQSGKQNERPARHGGQHSEFGSADHKLMEIAGFGDDALGARVAARVPAWMISFA